MLQIGATVLYGTEGVCTVAEICKMKVGGKREEYYVLKPVHRPNATVFVPANNEVLLAKVHPVLSKEEIDALIDGINGEDFLWIEDHAQRKTEFQKILLSGDRRELLRMIRCLYLQRQQLYENGKRLRSNDDQLLRDAEKLLNDEFALVLNIAPHEVAEYIRTRIEVA